MVQVQSPAPVFDLPALLHGKEIRVSSESLRGRWVVLAWYPKDDTVVCGSELPAFSAMKPELDARDATLIALSTQDLASKRAWVAKGTLGDLDIALAADDGKLAEAYGIRLSFGLALRATFLIDPEGILRWQCVHDLPIGRNTDEILRVLDALQVGSACLVNWHR